MVTLLPVQSSMFQTVGYSAVDRIFAGRFHNSNLVHHWRDVPPEVARDVMAADSIGKAFNAKIKGLYDSTAIEVDSAETQQPAEAEA